MAVLIDSSVIIELERRRLQPDFLASTVVSDEPSALSAITASELLAGVHRAGSPQHRLRRQAFVEAVLALLPVVPFDLRAARAHAQIWAQLMVAGQPIGAHDLLIAATALANGYSVLTNNLRDFGRVPGLSVLRP